MTLLHTMRMPSQVGPEIIGPENSSLIVAFVHGLGVDGHGRMGPDEPISAIDVVAGHLHAMSIPTAHIDLGYRSEGNELVRYERKVEDQVSLLGRATQEIRSRNYERVLYIGQSVGATVLMQHLEVSGEECAGVHLWAPPTFEDDEHARRLAEQFVDDGRSNIDMTGVSTIHSRGGVQVVVPPEYWPALDDFSVLESLGRSGGIDQRHAFFASQDRLYPKGAEYYGTELSDGEMTVLEGDSHTFRYPNMRQVLVDTTQELVGQLVS